METYLSYHLFLRENRGTRSGHICGGKRTSGQLIILLPQCRLPSVFRIEPNIDLPRSTTYRAVLHEGLATSPALIDVQLYVLAAVGTV